MNTKQFEVIRVSGVAMGVGYSEKILGGTFSESICSTLYDTGKDKKDAAESERWATIICDALNNQQKQ